MRSEANETIIKDAVHKVVWGNTKPPEYVADYVHGSMMSDQWDPFQMLAFELMALSARKQHGFDQLIEQD
tara:strand:- start:234 stop:443 length:210 start_codon:yes stop_codon:yes gene_type:complete